MRFTFAALVLVVFALEMPGKGAKGDLDKLQGEWAVTAMERDGKAAPKALVDNLKIIFDGDKMIMARIKGGGKDREFSVKLVPTKKGPRAIDLTALDGKVKGGVVHGIYEFDGTDLKLCISNSTGNERPTEFKAPEKSDLFVMSLTKAKK